MDMAIKVLPLFCPHCKVRANFVVYRQDDVWSFACADCGYAIEVGPGDEVVLEGATSTQRMATPDPRRQAPL